MRRLSSRARLATATGALLACAVSAATSRAVTPPAPKPPSIVSSYATPLSASTAIVRAKLNAHGLATEYRIEYGPTPAYGALTPPASAGSGTQIVAVTQTIGSLAPLTAYHYRVVATNSAGTVRGREGIFTTRKVPLSLTLTAATNPIVFGSSLTVSGALAGTGSAGSEVVLEGNPFPYSHGFHDLTAPETTSAAGTFSFPVAGMLESTQLRVATVARPVIFSPVLTEDVTLRVTLHVRRARRRGFVRFYGTVTPAATGAPVAFELMDSQRQFITISGTRAHGSGGVSRFSRAVRLRHRGIYRALVEIPGGAQISGRSRSIAVR